MDDLTTLQSSIQYSLVATTRSVTRLAAEDLSFHRSLHPRLGSNIDKQNARLLDITERLLGTASSHAKAVRPTLKDIDDVDDNWTKVVDVIDSLLERADTALDEFTGAVRKLTPKDQAERGLPSRQDLYRTRNIIKPQLNFTTQVDNYPSTPFKPLLDSKPNSTISLQLEPTTTEENAVLHFAQPYKHEIENFTFPERMYETAEPIPFTPLDESTATLVDTEEALAEMLQELKSAQEIAIDLEHHDTRSYVGIVCLMQISTRDRDWVVDTLKPWRRKLQCLNEVFTDPSIVKVLHGAYMDIIWLQRDLGLYVVGLFDTYNASRALGYPGNSYAYLLKRFTGVDAQKQYQLADWRIRPLPQELLDYARSDTHYLLYIFDNMRNELIVQSDFTAPDKEKDKIHDVLERSRETALQRYEYHVYDFETGQGGFGWYKLIARTPVHLSKEQFSVLRAVHRWRDNIARQQDDSPNFIMPNAQVISLAQIMPASQQELDTMSNLAQSAKDKSEDLLAVIAEAKAAGPAGPDMMEVLEAFDPKAAARKAGLTQRLVASTPGSTQSTGVIAAVKSSALRTLKSFFWGSAIDSSTSRHNGQRREMSTTADNLRFHVPLPPLSANVFADGVKASTPEPVSPVAPLTTANPELIEEDEVFTLRELGRKRKLAEATDRDGLAAQSDQITLPDEAAERLAAKAERKKARKEAKRAAKAAAGEANPEVSDGADDDTPYDYASAPSLLHQPAPNKHAKKQGKQMFNPYAKALDTPKGLPRVQKESAGRSMTYAS